MPVVCNVADASSIEAMTAEVLDQWGRVDILMNNAAIQPPGGNIDIQPKHWELIYKVNVHGSFHCIQSVLPAMIDAGCGNIINISSMAADWDYPSPYAATKRAVEAMTIGMAHELMRRGIAVNALKPTSIIETPGYLYAQVPRDEVDTAEDFPPPDSYVEAAILLALQTPETFTGQVHKDAEVIGRLADAQTRKRFADLNPESWTEFMNSVKPVGGA